MMKRLGQHPVILAIYTGEFSLTMMGTTELKRPAHTPCINLTRKNIW